MHTVCALHQTEVVVACSNAVPRLTCALKVAYVLIAYLEIVLHPRHTSIVTATATWCAVYETIGVSLMVGAVDYQVVA